MTRRLSLLPRLSLLTLLLLTTADHTHAQESTAATKEPVLLLPEPSVMRSPRSLIIGGARQTVVTPAREITDSPGIETYTKEELERLGISPETFALRAGKAADQLLAGLQPDWVYDEAGKVQYAVFRGDRPIYASLLLAASLPVLFEAAFGPEIWVALPDRNALYVFPPNQALVDEFLADLRERYESDPYAASCELFRWKKGAAEPVVLGSFAE